MHNVESGTAYPATLVTTGDHDDRVVPAHSFKFAAHLQAKQSGAAPVMIRIEKMPATEPVRPPRRLLISTRICFPLRWRIWGIRADVAGLARRYALNPRHDIAYGHIDGFFAVEPRFFGQLGSGN
ncbi:MAG: hypothetical protein CM15mP120_08520 [Pseudomonadota bacterium]|nr:MAG: hypothetical protein CM15mP120_08520 [Pseudomonadota bacterium]